MPHVVAVHGIGQQFLGENTLLAQWLPALHDGLLRAGYPSPESVEVRCAFYGDLFRRPGTRDIGLPPYTSADVGAGWETDLLQAWWQEAARVETGVLDPNVTQATRTRTPQMAQRALNALTRSPFFTGLVERAVFERALIASLKQVYAYLHDPEVRVRVRQRVEEQVTPETRVVVAHSLGTVVAYECLCAHPEWSVTALITLGSPLGIRNLIFDLLDPRPTAGLGAWPGSVRQWTNIADEGDVVALQKELRPLFGEGVADFRVYNGSRSHSITSYLTSEETGRALANALSA